jgi:hypothetical protein
LGADSGDTAAAESYAAWVRQAIEKGRWGEAEAALERAADYAAVSSDLSYLLALARSHEGRPGGAALEAVRRSLETDRWRFYTPEAARLLEAETLITLMAYSEALRSLSPVPESAESCRLRLLAFKGLGDAPRFRSSMAQVLDRYPRDVRPARILFEFYRPPAYGYSESGGRGAAFFQDRRPPVIEAADRDLVALALRRLPLLVEDDPALAYLAAPFIRDTEEARRLVGAYRARGGSDPEALPAALGLGLIGGGQAADEFFYPHNGGSGEPVLDRALLESIWALLREEQDRNRFMRNLLGFSGVITEDRNRDGFPETRVRYRDGMILDYSRDAGQTGIAGVEIRFTAGMPDRGSLVLLPEDDGRPFAYAVSGADRPRVRVWWERYPSVLRTELGETTYIPRPLEFPIAPVRFVSLPGSGEPIPPQAGVLGSGGLLYPEGVTLYAPALSRRTLVFFAAAIEQPGGNFNGAVERVELERGVPRRAREHLNGRIVSETEFLLGRPAVQRIDLDLDGHMETIRRFRQDIPPLDFEDTESGRPWDYGTIMAASESDWDGDGIFEYGEEYLSGGVVRSWDMNRDGVKEYSETERD